MCDQDMQWTGSWVADKIKTADDVQQTEIVEPQILKIKRQYDSFMLGTIALERVDGATVRILTGKCQTLSFIVNIPKDSFWTGDAIDLVSQYSIAFGGMSDLYRALSRTTDVRQYVNPEFFFVERVLNQHRIIKQLRRVHDRKYVLKRRKLRDFTIVLINEYDLTKDHVREAIGRYGAFDAVLITNPNGRTTTQAKETAESMEIEIYKIGQLMARINDQ